MANQMIFTQQQLQLIRDLRDAGPANFPEVYNRIYEWIQPNPNVDDQSKLFFRFAVEVNNNAPTPSNLYIRTVTRLGLEADGKDASPTKIQEISNAIAVGIFSQILVDGGLPPLNTIIRLDVTGAIQQGGQTWGGWGGSLFFLPERVGPNQLAPESLAKLIFSSGRDTLKFEIVTIAGVAQVRAEHGAIVKSGVWPVDQAATCWSRGFT